MLYWGPTGPATFTADVEVELEKLWCEGDRDPLAIYANGFTLPARRYLTGVDEDYRDAWTSSGVTAGTFNVELSSSEVALSMFAGLQSLFDRIPWLSKILKSDDIRRVKHDGHRGGIVNTQLVTGPGPDLLGRLSTYHELGLRMLMLTYNSMNALGAGCTERTDAGVSRYGKKVIAEMNDLGILVDTAHCGHRTTIDACNMSARPVVASHTTARAVFSHIRGKTDDELTAIARTGGVIGVVLVPFFLSSHGASIDLALDHIEYISRLVGWQHVAVGTDWPLAVPQSLQTPVGRAYLGSSFRPEDGLDFDRHTAGFGDYREFPNLTRGLVARGFSDHEIAGILGENAVRVLAEACD